MCHGFGVPFNKNLKSSHMQGKTHQIKKVIYTLGEVIFSFCRDVSPLHAGRHLVFDKRTHQILRDTTAFVHVDTGNRQI